MCDKTKSKFEPDIILEGINEVVLKTRKLWASTDKNIIRVGKESYTTMIKNLNNSREWCCDTPLCNPYHLGELNTIPTDTNYLI